nr:probably inactive leucine-rich repeat receptor-like protein kinase IMK2 [Ziziphus jujuba var. spinosa]
MPKLEYLSLASNNLQDVISSAIENLTSIVYLHFSNNSLEGELPTTVRNLCTLSFNDLGDNQSGGKISNAFKSMSSGCVLNSLRSLDLTSESFCGHLTDQIVEFKNLESLSLGHNRISGPIPVSLGNFPALQILEFNSNKLDGSLPESLGGLFPIYKNFKFLPTFLKIVSGEIPRSLQNSKRLTVIDLGLNELVDGIPKWVGSRLLRLEAFSLRSNKLNGHIPFEVSNLPALQIIDVAENSLSGTIPKRINNLKAMANKQDSSKLMGEIPQQLTTLQGLLSLNLSGNFFKGSIQYNIGNPKSLESLDFSRNQLSAIIPSSLSSLSFLSSLNLSFNNLSGKIPSNTPLQNFNASSFIGNELCGPPLTKNCDGEQTVPTIDQHGEEDGDEIGHWFRLASLLHYCCAKPGGMLPLSFLVTSGTSFSTSTISFELSSYLILLCLVSTIMLALKAL